MSDDILPGAGLPSICAHICHPRLICCSDYPVQAVLDNIKENAERSVRASPKGEFFNGRSV